MLRMSEPGHIPVTLANSEYARASNHHNGNPRYFASTTAE